TGRGNSIRLRRVKPQVVGMSVESVVDVTEESVGELWELVPVVVARTITLGIATGLTAVRSVEPGAILGHVTIVVRPDTCRGSVPRCKWNRTRGVVRGGPLKARAKLQHRVSTSCPRTPLRPNLSRRSLVCILNLNF